MTRYNRATGTLFVLSLLALFGASAQWLKTTERQDVAVEMQVALPRSVQVAVAGGDRHLAANIAAIRALWVDTSKMQPEQFSVLARVQEDVAWLNAAHEDNYYAAAAILPWSGELDAAQRILQAATLARRFDYQPPFYYAFNQLHFRHDPIGASRMLQDAAPFLPDPDEQLQMQNLAAIWLERAEDPDLAIRVIESLAKQATRRDFRKYLEMRAARLRSLQGLQSASETYRKRFGRELQSLDSLVEAGLISVLPADPFGFGYELAADGKVILRNSPVRKK